ncbi:hypothetical protein Tco_1421402 [Tanacetum coccineum]
MAQPQRPADVHQDELCLPNKRYALMDANKKINLDNPLYPNESKIMANIIQNHPLRFNIAASSSVPWIYLRQFWHTLQEDGSKYRLKFVLDRKEITMTLNDFKRIFHLPQATDNNHERFVAAPKFSEMVPFFLNTLGFTLELRLPSNFKTTRLTLQTAFPEISHRAHDKYHNLEDDAMVKNIFNSGKHKDGLRMKISSWMITDEMKLTDHYQVYAVVFGVDLPTTQSQPIKSAQGTHRTPSAPRSPNPEIDEEESSALRKSTIIRLCIPQRRSTRLTPPTPIPTTAEADDIILRDTIQLSLAEQKSRDKLEAQQNVQKDDTQTIPDTMLEPRSNKESPEVEITAEVQPVNINEEEEESIEDDYELKRMEKGKNVEESRHTPSPTTIRSPRIYSTLISSDTEKL